MTFSHFALASSSTQPTIGLWAEDVAIANPRPRNRRSHSTRRLAHPPIPPVRRESLVIPLQHGTARSTHTRPTPHTPQQSSLSATLAPSPINTPPSSPPSPSTSTISSSWSAMTAFWGSRASEFLGGVSAGAVATSPPPRPVPVQAPQCGIVGFAEPSSPECDRSVAESDSAHRRSRSREFFGHFGLGGSKGVQREEEDHMMDVDVPEAPISLVFPESLPSCSLAAAFQCSDSSSEIPPAFYPGQAIPTILTFQLDGKSYLRHTLNPTLTMSLIGTLCIPGYEPRTIICVSVSLAEGLALWARDAGHAYAGKAPSATVPDVSIGLPGGTYSLPLTVQVPATPRLPPSFEVDGATFAVSYALNVTLTCDDIHRFGNRVVLAETGRSFEMLPETLPSRAPRFQPQSFWVRMGNDVTQTGPLISKSSARLGNYRWSVKPFLPTTTFSPTSIIPLELEFTPPPELPDQEYQILIRLSLVRREHTSLDGSGPVDPNLNDRLVQDKEVVVRWGWIEADGHSSVRIPNLDLPLMLGSEWKHGFSTMLNVGSARSQYGHNHVTEHSGISVASTFHLNITLAFLPLGGKGAASGSFPPSLREALSPAATEQMLAPGMFGPAQSPEESAIGLHDLRRHFPGTVRTLPIPVVIGSVAEPRDAMHTTRWSDLHLEQRNGRERGRMIHGEATSCEDGWLCPPPSYKDAVRDAPYVYDVMRGEEIRLQRELIRDMMRRAKALNGRVSEGGVGCGDGDVGMEEDWSGSGNGRVRVVGWYGAENETDE